MSDNEQTEENEIIAQRRANLAELRNEGNPFPNDFRREALASALHERFGNRTKEELEDAGQMTAVAGRIVLRRIMGKASFATIQDMSGRIQLYVRRDDLPEGV